MTVFEKWAPHGALFAVFRLVPMGWTHSSHMNVTALGVGLGILLRQLDTSFKLLHLNFFFSLRLDMVLAGIAIIFQVTLVVCMIYI